MVFDLKDKANDISKVLWVLYSQDQRTKNIGFDLQENIDTLQSIKNKQEREKYIKELIKSW